VMRDRVFFVRAIENLFLPGSNNEVIYICEDLLRNNSPRNTLHSFLFIGTKRLSYYHRTGSFRMDPSDLFSLILYFRSVFHPALTCYRYRYTEESSDDEDYVSAEESWSDDKENPFPSEEDLLRMYNLLLLCVYKIESMQ